MLSRKRSPRVLAKDHEWQLGERSAKPHLVKKNHSKLEKISMRYLELWMLGFAKVDSTRAVGAFWWSFFSGVVMASLVSKVDAQNQLEDVPRIPPKNVVLKFVDSNDEPIEGVTFTTNSLVYLDNSGVSFGATLKNSNGGALVSSVDGSIECVVPDMQFGNLARMRLDTDHDEFVAFDDSISITDDVTKIVLQRGVQVAVTAIDAQSKESIKKNLFGIAERNKDKQLKDWKLMQNGTLISPALPADAHRVRIVEIVEGQAIRFSDPIDIEQQDGGKKFEREVPMHPAIVLKGKLNPQIPRPIKNGQVNICVAWNAQKDLKFGDEAGHWFDRVAVDEDGQFEIAGIPPGDWLQLIATCDGWVSQASPKELRQTIYPALDNRVDATVLPRLLNLSDLPADLVVDMVPRRTVFVEVLDDAGKPVKNASLSIVDYPFISNGRWGRITRDELIAAREKREFFVEYFTPTRVVKTDENGVAAIPEFYGDKLNLYLKGYEITNQGIGAEWIENKKTIRVVPKDE